MNFILRLFARRTKPVAVPFQPPAATDWTALDRDRLRAVLNSETGRKLIARLRGTEYAVAVANAKDQFHTQHAAGHTCGYSDCIKHLLSLSVSCAASQENDSGTPGEVLPIEREAEDYRIRMSP